MESSQRTVAVDNIGPVKHVSIEFPEGGGIVVLRGRNGSGKSTTINAVDSLVSGRGKLSVRDGELKGSVTGFGATITVGRTTRRSGADELDVVTLEGKHSVGEIVDPQIDSPAAADARRIKALVALARSPVSIQIFRDIFAGDADAEALLNVKETAGEDLLTVAMRLKRALEEKARGFQAEADGLLSKAASELEADKDIPLDRPYDEKGLQADYTAAVRIESSLKADAMAAANALASASAAKERLAALPEVKEDIGQRMIAMRAAIDDGETQVRELDAMLTKAKADLTANLGRLETLEQEKAAFDSRESLVAELQTIIDRSAEQPLISAERIKAAEDLVSAKRQDVEQGAAVRRAMERIKDAHNKKTLASIKALAADKYRSYASRVEEPLAAIVAKLTPNLQVEAGRLVTTMEVDGRPIKKYFHDLSPGERCRLAFELSIEAIGLAMAEGQDGILTIEQELWAAMDPDNRRETAILLQDAGICALAAEVGENGLEAETYDPATS